MNENQLSNNIVPEMQSEFTMVLDGQYMEILS